MAEPHTTAERPAIRAYPPHLTFQDLIRRNRRNSALLMALMGSLLVLVGAAASILAVAWGGGVGDLPELLMVGAGGALVAAVVAVIAILWSYYGGAETILRISGAELIEKSSDPQLYNVVEELAIAAGVPPPKVYVIDDTALNAFATGRDPEHAAVAITSGLRAQLNRSELAGVLAHEMSHIRHYDIRMAMLMATMVGLIVLTCDALWHVVRRSMWFGRGARVGGRGRTRGGGGQVIIIAIILVVVIVLAIVAPTLAMLIRLAVSRQREYLADAGAVELTRDPEGLISALQKLSGCKDVLEAANRATTHLYIVSPILAADSDGKGHELNSAFSTHPPMQERIARLRALVT